MRKRWLRRMMLVGGRLAGRLKACRGRAAALAACLTLLVVLYHRGGLPALPGWGLFNGQPAMSAGGSLGLVRGDKGKGRKKTKKRRKRRRGRRKRAPKFDAMGSGLRDALSPEPLWHPAQQLFWDKALDGVSSSRRTRSGRIRSRRQKASRMRFPRAKRARSARPKAQRSRSRRKTARKTSGRKAARPASRKSEARARRAVSRSKTPRVDFDGRSGGGSFLSAGAHIGVGSLKLSSWKPKKEKKKEAKEEPPPKQRDLMGKTPLKAPSGKLDAPSFSDLKYAFPETLPDGRPYARSTPGPAHFERLPAPDEHPEYGKWIEKDERRGRKDEPHWHFDSKNVWHYHMGKTWGRCDRGRWAWFRKKGRQWWTVADGAQRMARHKGHWWWKTERGWFLLRQGKAWGYARAQAMIREGKLVWKDKTAVSYAGDRDVMAVKTPGYGTWVLRVASGEVLGRYPE